jgi:hypothetical protein
MRTLILTILLFTFNAIHAQDSLMVVDIHEDISAGYKPGNFVTIPITNSKDISSAWKKQLKNDSKGDVTDKKNEMVLTKTILPAISSDTIVIYSRITSAISPKSGTDMKIFVMAGDSSFISSNEAPAIDGRIKNYLRTFAVDQYKNAVAEELNIEQKKLNQLREDLKKLEHDNENHKKRIKSNQAENMDLQEKIYSNDEVIDTKTSEIAQQANTVADAQAEDQKSDEEKKLKHLQKDKEKLLDEKQSNRKKIEKNNDANEDLQKQLDLNTSTNIPNKKEEIGREEEVVRNLSQKLNAIR